MTVPYTYLIKHVPTNMYYYGCRFAKNCDPSELWIKYKTSSKAVKLLIEQYGENSFQFEIRKTFDDANAARSWENRVLKRMNVINRNDFINLTDNISISHAAGELGRKNRISSEAHRLAISKVGKSNLGLKRTDATKAKISNALMGNKYKSGVIESDKSREKKRQAHLGKSSGMLGKTHSKCSCVKCGHVTIHAALANHYRYNH